MRASTIALVGMLCGCGPGTLFGGDTPRDAGAPSDAAMVTPPRVTALSARAVGVAEFDGVSQPVGQSVVFVGAGNIVRSSEDQDPSDGVRGFTVPREVLPHESAGCPGFLGASPYAARAWLWDGAVARLFFEKACSRGGIGDDFRGVGIARATDLTRGVALPNDGPIRAEPELRFGPTDFRPTTGLLRVGVGDAALVYAWDCRDFHDYRYGCRLAQAPASRVEDPTAWRYRVRDGWSNVGPGDEQLRGAGDSLTVSWNAALQRYLMVYGSWAADFVFYRTAMSPEGPWSDEQRLFATQRPVVDGLWSLQAHHHPAWDRADGTIFVTYRTTADGGRTVTIPVTQVQLGLR